MTDDADRSASASPVSPTQGTASALPSGSGSAKTAVASAADSQQAGAGAERPAASAAGSGSLQASAEPALPPPPEGAGVVRTTRNGRPALVVYFDTAMSNVAEDFPAAATDLKDYVAGHPSAKLAVSGFNDPTGNVEKNEALSRHRAEHVAEALQKMDIPASAIALEKPADTESGGTTNAELRRVEVTIKED